MNFCFYSLLPVNAAGWLVALCGAFATCNVLANDDQHPGQAYVTQSGEGSDARYQYTLLNGSTTAVVTTFILGFDYYRRQPELNAEPTSVESPPGWESELVFTEETLEFEVKWRSTDPEYDIAPGASKTGFAVVLPQADLPYRRGHFTMIFGNSMISSKRLVDHPAPETTESSPTF